MKELQIKDAITVVGGNHHDTAGESFGDRVTHFAQGIAETTYKLTHPLTNQLIEHNHHESYWDHPGTCDVNSNN